MNKTAQLDGIADIVEEVSPLVDEMVSSPMIIA